MANPFDEIIDVPEKKEPETPTPRPQAAPKQETKPKTKEGVNISFTLNKQTIERGVFMIIILFLGGMLIFNSATDTCNINECSLTEITGNAVAEVNNEVEIAVVGEEKEKVVEEVVEEAVEEVEDSELPFSGNFDFEIISVDYTTDGGSPIKMTNIVFKMTNNWQDLLPDIQAFWYDPDASVVFQEKIRKEVSLPTLVKGKAQTITLENFDSTYFDPTNTEETIKIVLIDRNTGEILANSKKTIP